jgi:complement component 1 Q subcomponent-binding protein
MAFRHLITRTLCQFVKRTNINPRLYSSIQQPQYRRLELIQRYVPIRTFSSVQTNDNAYRNLDVFLQKEIQLEKSTQKHPSNMPNIPDFQVQTNGPEVTLTRQTGTDKVVVKFNVTNTVNGNESDSNPPEQDQQGNESSSQLKSRPTFTVDINRGGQTLSFLCSYLPNDYPNTQEQEHELGNEQKQEDFLEDFQIDEFTIHDGEWNETVYSSDCSVIDGELYDKLLNLLEEHGIGEVFANQLADYSTAYEHRQYIGLLEKLQEFVKK